VSAEVGRPGSFCPQWFRVLSALIAARHGRTMSASAGGRRVDRAGMAALHENGQRARVVGEHDGVDRGGLEPERDVPLDRLTTAGLDEVAIEENARAVRGRQEVRRAGDSSGGAEELDLQTGMREARRLCESERRVSGRGRVDAKANPTASSYRPDDPDVRLAIEERQRARSRREVAIGAVR
jgi:hypothetical protein